MIPISFRMLTLSGFLLVTALGFSSAHAATFTNGRDVSSVCLDVRGGNTANHTPVQSYPCNATFAQVWNWDSLEIQSLEGGKCLDVAGGGTADGTPIQLFQCNDSSAQFWYFSLGQVINRGSGKCLDVGNGATSTQARIVTCNLSNGQSG